MLVQTLQNHQISRTIQNVLDSGCGENSPHPSNSYRSLFHYTDRLVTQTPCTLFYPFILSNNHSPPASQSLFSNTLASSSEVMFAMYAFACLRFWSNMLKLFVCVPPLFSGSEAIPFPCCHPLVFVTCLVPFELFRLAFHCNAFFQPLLRSNTLQTIVDSVL